jgi:hypothetical protein
MRRKFKTSWIIRFGLLIALRGAGGEILGVLCRFCIRHGRELPGGKRNRKLSPWHFTSEDWRPFKFKSHIESHHQIEWENYNNPLSNKLTFFDEPITLDSFFSECEDCVNYTVAVPIVESICKCGLSANEHTVRRAMRDGNLIHSPLEPAESLSDSNHSQPVVSHTAQDVQILTFQLLEPWGYSPSDGKLSAPSQSAGFGKIISTASWFLRYMFLRKYVLIFLM